METNRQFERGQALLMVTVGLVVTFGMVALAVDLGWGYFVLRTAQSAADAAALAAAQTALEIGEQNGPYACGSGIVCQARAPCPEQLPESPAGTVEVACAYAARNRFRMAAGQTVEVEADVTPTPPTALGRVVHYWVTVRTSQTLPRMFAAMISDSDGVASVRATAAVIDAPVDGSLILLNRQNDAGPVGTGVALSGGGNAVVRGDEGILLASSSERAGDIGGTVQVLAPFTFIRGAGGVSEGPGATWTEAPQNGFRDSGFFKDPLRGKPQPPPPTGLTPQPLEGGILQGSNDPGAPLEVSPGAYYAVQTDKKTGVQTASGAPIQVQGHVRFVSGGPFGGYVFFGGLDVSSNGARAIFGPGRYVLAGTTGDNIISFGNQVVLEDNTPLLNNQAVPASDAGELFILTDASYPGLEVPAEVLPISDQLHFGKANLHGGNNAQTLVNLHGLNPGHPDVPEELKPYAPIVFWQDRRNSTVAYTDDGQIRTDCAAGRTLDLPCETGVTETPEMHLQATPKTHLSGAIYQPRGAWLTLQGSGTITAPVQVVTGAVDVQGGPDLMLLGVPVPLKRKVAALVE
jgi:hypothetical protein